MPLGLTRCEAEHLFAVGTQSQAYLYNTYVCAYMYNTCIYTASQKINTYWHSQCSNKPNQHQQPYPVPSLSGQGQDEGPFVENAHTDRWHNVDPSSNWPETLSLASGCPWIPGLPSCWHLGTWPSSAAAPFPLPVQNTLAHTWKCTHTHRHTCWGPLYVQPTLRPLSLYFSTLVPPQNTLTLQFPAYGPPLSIP